MKMDRNIESNDGKGKYALLLLRKIKVSAYGGAKNTEIAAAIKTLEDAGVLDWGFVGTKSEFFLLRLRDLNAQAALRAYGGSARSHDPEWAQEVMELASRAGPDSPFCKLPD